MRNRQQVNFKARLARRRSWKFVGASTTPPRFEPNSLTTTPSCDQPLLPEANRPGVHIHCACARAARDDRPHLPSHPLAPPRSPGRYRRALLRSRYPCPLWLRVAADHRIGPRSQRQLASDHSLAHLVLLRFPLHGLQSRGSYASFLLLSKSWMPIRGAPITSIHSKRLIRQPRSILPAGQLEVLLAVLR